MTGGSKLYVVSLISSIAALAMLAAGGAPAADEAIPATAWKAIELNGKGVVGPTLDTSPHKVSGVAGCNRFFGPISVSPPDGVKIGPLATTRMMCQGDLALERDYLAALAAARTFAIEDGALILKGDGGAALVKFRK